LGDETTKRLEDEPDEARGLEDVLSVRLSVDHTLEAEWTLFNQRVEQGEQGTRTLAFQDRQDIAPSRLGPYADRHLAWGRQSVLNRITKGPSASRGLMAEAGRVARQEFSKDSKTLFAETIEEVKRAARLLGVPVGNALHAMLDVQAMGLSGGGISLHDGDLPLRRLGVGSSRLFTAALQDYARAKASVALIDEVEHGLEPHRISKLSALADREAAAGFRESLRERRAETRLARLFWRRVDGILLSDFEQGEIGPDLFRHACCWGWRALVQSTATAPTEPDGSRTGSRSRTESIRRWNG
jgi:putative ATP-dependent endonuclease of the OLD family